MNREQIAWAAGLFEGEGSISSNRRTARLDLVMTDKDVVERFRSIVEVGSGDGPVPNTGKGDKPLYRWRCYGFNAYRVMELFEPWLLERRRAQWQRVRETWENAPRKKNYMKTAERDWHGRILPKAQ